MDKTFAELVTAYKEAPVKTEAKFACPLCGKFYTKADYDKIDLPFTPFSCPVDYFENRAD